MPKQLQIPISDVVELLVGRKKKKKAKKAKKVKALKAPQGENRFRQGYQGQSSFRVVPSDYQQFLQPPAQLIKPMKEVERAQTININTNYDPDHRREGVVVDSKGGVAPLEFNPNDISPAIRSRRLIQLQPLYSSSSSYSQAPFQAQRPASQLNHQSIQREVINAPFYNPLAPGGGRQPPQMIEDIEEYGAYEKELLDQALMAPDEGDIDAYKRLTKLTRRNPVTGQLEQYSRGGPVSARAFGGRFGGGLPVNVEAPTHFSQGGPVIKGYPFNRPDLYR